MHSDPKPSYKADVVVVNAYPIVNQGIDWSGARTSLQDGGSAIAISQHPWGFATFHNHEIRNWGGLVCKVIHTSRDPFPKHTGSKRILPR